MASTVGNRPSQYRAKAQEARQRAGAVSDEAQRQRLLNDAHLWDRMAEYEEKNPTHDFQSYYPKNG